MFNRPMFKLIIAMLILPIIPGCVSKSTFEDMAGQASKLDTDLTDLQGRHQTLLAQQSELQASHSDLQKRQAELQASHEALTNEKTRLEKENRDLLAQKEALTASNRELEGILAAREDSLSKKIAEQRQELTAQQTEYNGRLSGLDEQLRQKSLQLADLEGKITQLEAQLTVANATNGKLNEDLRLLREEKEKEVQKMTSTYQALLDGMKSEIDKGQITISELKGKLTVNMVDAILFDSGKAEVKPDGLLVLQRVIDILKGVSGKTIRIEGHTDNVQIIGALAQKYPTNWELSAARAVNVARFLQERGIDPLNLNAVAYGEYKPVADNTSDAGRARNRRIEIILVDRE